MTTYGLTSTGWVSKPLSQIESEIDTGLQGILGSSAATEPDGTIPVASMAGQLKVLWSDGFGAQWDLLQALAASVDPAQATDAAQDTVCSLTGTVRQGAFFSTVTGTCTGTPNTILPVTRVATVAGTGSRFDSLVALNLSDPNYPASTITALTAWAQSTGYTVGQRRTANGNAYQCSQNGTSSNTGTGPAGTTLGVDITDGSCKWRFLGVGTGAVDVAFQAEVAGAIGALANQLIQIATPISGWSAITNLSNASVGQLQEGNADLRLKRDAELAADGVSTADAIRGVVLKVNATSTDPNHLPITSCTVFHNDTDATDANGVPPHAVEVLVFYNNNVDVPTTDQDIANAIYASLGAGIATTGNQTATVTDSQGNTHTVKWSKPTAVPIWVTYTVFYNPADWPASGAAALVQQASLSALLTFTATFPVGQSVRAAPLIAAILEGPSQTDTSGNAVVPAAAGSPPAPGLLDVSPLNIGTAPSPGSSTPIAITSRQIATFVSADIVITATPESP